MYEFTFWMYDTNGRFVRNHVEKGLDVDHILLILKVTYGTDFTFFPAKVVQLPPTPKFYYSGYWGCWQRILYDDGQCIITVHLTPINGFSKRTIKEITSETIGTQRSVYSPTDSLTDTLPQEVIDQMTSNMGFGFTDKLLEHDYLTEVRNACDSDIYKTILSLSNGNGVPLMNLKSKTYHRWE